MLRLNRGLGPVSGCRCFNALQIRGQGRVLHVLPLQQQFATRNNISPTRTCRATAVRLSLRPVALSPVGKGKDVRPHHPDDRTQANFFGGGKRWGARCLHSPRPESWARPRFALTFRFSLVRRLRIADALALALAMRRARAVKTDHLGKTDFRYLEEGETTAPALAPLPARTALPRMTGLRPSSNASLNIRSWALFDKVM
jgi:hypothetical protein